jgi:hypothetical protein
MSTRDETGLLGDLSDLSELSEGESEDLVRPDSTKCIPELQVGSFNLIALLHQPPCTEHVIALSGSKKKSLAWRTKEGRF